MTTITTKRTVVPVLLMVVALIGTISYFRDEMSEFQFPSLVLVDEDGRVLQILEDENATNTTDFPTTFEPSVEETPFPTASPTSGPTSGPSGAPSSSPSASPTATAETPAPTAEATTPEPSPSPFFGDDEVEALTRTPTTASPSIAPFQFPEGTTSEKDEAFPQAMIIGISAGAAACLFLLAGVLLCYKNKKRVPKDGESAFLSNGKSHNTSYSNKSPQIFIPAHGGDEVSTLGDPAGLYGGNSRKNIFEDDACSLNTSSMNRMLDHATHAVDPESLRDPGECFDVRLPAGKAGIILEEGPDSYPVVHSIKPGSPLMNRVRPGDRLCSIEGIDCAGMSPHVVAKKLQAHEHASSRILSFSRPIL